MAPQQTRRQQNGGYKKQKFRPYCLCSRPECTEWRYADKLSREALRCKCGQLFRTEHMPDELLAAHRKLEDNDRNKNKDKNTKPAAEKPPEEFDIGSNIDADADMGDAADQDLDFVKKELAEKGEKISAQGVWRRDSNRTCRKSGGA